jgi:hypothetical protein
MQKTSNEDGSSITGLAPATEGMETRAASRSSRALFGVDSEGPDATLVLTIGQEICHAGGTIVSIGTNEAKKCLDSAVYRDFS